MCVGRRRGRDGGTKRGLVTDSAAWKDFAEILGCCYIIRNTNLLPALSPLNSLLSKKLVKMFRLAA